jgi:MoaD family protein
MVKVTLRYFASIREALGSSEETAVVDGETVPDVLKWLLEKHGERLVPQVLNARGELQREYRMLHNGSVSLPKKMAKERIADGDEFVLMPPVAGG